MASITIRDPKITFDRRNLHPSAVFGRHPRKIDKPPMASMFGIVYG